MATTQNPVQASVTPEPILQLAMGFMASKHLFVANAIGLFEQRANGPTTLDAVAARSGVPRRTVRIIADAMAALGLVEREGDQYQNAPVAAAYLSGRTATDLRPLLRFWDHLSYAGWQQLEAAVRSGQAPTRHGRFSDEDQRIFSEGVEALTAGPAHALASNYDFSQHRRVLDLGGGTGSFLLAMVHRYPDVQATLFELPTAAAVARQRLEREALQQPIEVVSGDFFTDPLPAGQDAIILANVVHLFSPERNQVLLRRARQAVAPGARLLLVDFWTDPTHTQPLPAALLAGEFLVIAGEGDVYSQDELHGWLAGSGWRPLEHRALTGPASLVIAEAE
jgi:SAM-dependent methyltransferase